MALHVDESINVAVVYPSGLVRVSGHLRDDDFSRPYLFERQFSSYGKGLEFKASYEADERLFLRARSKA